MGDASASSAAVATISAMVTPVLLLLGSTALVASALTRMARVVDRARVLALAAHERAPERLGTTTAQLAAWLARHAARARYCERAIMLLYAAIVLFVATCLCIGVDHVAGPLLGWLPLLLAAIGTVLLFAGACWMFAESRLSAAQIAEEIALALARLQGDTP